MPHDDPANFEFTPDEMRAMGRDTLERVIAHIESLAVQPICSDLGTASTYRDMREPVPDAPSELGPLLDRLFDDWIPRSFTPSGPGYLAFIPGGGLFPAALADLIADTTNRFTGIWHAAPALVQLEANVLDWFRDWMGFPESTRGLLTTGGSMAPFNAILCARERLGPDIRRGVVCVSTEAHHSVRKAAKLAGIMLDRVRTVPVDDRAAIRVDALEEVVARDREAGMTPLLVASSAGTVKTGTIDPLTPSPTSVPARGCGTTSTARTARSFVSATPAGPVCTGSNGPIL
jgi:aromatic-L-amino-acid decarboxylase